MKKSKKISNKHPKKRRIHVCPPATASQIRRSLRISRQQVVNAKSALRSVGISV